MKAILENLETIEIVQVAASSINLSETSNDGSGWDGATNVSGFDNPSDLEIAKEPNASREQN